ncbi:hypothetical protein HYDPIDRAFT_188453 [Hydnomerulius pinastri MD-312]|uniref:Uncharacterized protein n=1 Tax=Hydnomerulius pinastri MD-312 TaxID=994086 RepID=A0A0C9VCA1_9AGAM|nr:hypothetical protein HYDPIDRAFT_188453 [Hydnomerulius pinastri MD-312]
MALGRNENRSPTGPERESGSTGSRKKTTAGGQAKSACPATREVLQNKNNELSAEVERLMAELQQTQQARDAAEKAAQTAEAAKLIAEEQSRNRSATANGSVTPTVIPKPPDTELKEGGKGRLARAMRLEDNKSEYLAIIATVHYLCPRVGLDYDVRFVDQPPASLGKLFRLARRSHPHLELFQNDWATAALVKQFLQNKRKQQNKKRKMSADGHQRHKRRRFGDDDDDEEEEEDEETPNGQMGRGSGSRVTSTSGDNNGFSELEGEDE